MPTVEEIATRIEERMRALHAEREALEAARTALVREGGRSGRSRSAAAEPPATAEASDGAAADRSAGVAAPGRARRRRRTPLTADVLTGMLAEHTEGLSAITISKRAGAPYREVIERLRELEESGRIRRSGARRTSLWHLADDDAAVTDDEWIAQRTAELERLAAQGSSTAAETTAAVELEGPAAGREDEGEGAAEPPTPNSSGSETGSS